MNDLTRVSVQTDDGIYVCGFEPDEREWRELVVMAFDEGKESEPIDENEDVLERTALAADR
ncbi:hypothetical protein ACYJ1Y_13640 [Natrialbaceae archaeon A-gly3]